MDKIAPAVPVVAPHRATIKAAAPPTIPKNSVNRLAETVLPLTETASNHELSSARYSIAVDELNVLLSSHLRMEVLEALSLYYLPHAPQWCSGLVNLRGQPIPALRLQQLFYPKRKRQMNTQSYQWLLIIRSEQYAPVAFILDALPRLIHANDCQQGGLDILESGINIAPQLAMFISDIYRYKDKELLMLLNHERLLAVLKQHKNQVV